VPLPRAEQLDAGGLGGSGRIDDGHAIFVVLVGNAPGFRLDGFTALRHNSALEPTASGSVSLLATRSQAVQIVNDKSRSTKIAAR